MKTKKTQPLTRLRSIFYCWPYIGSCPYELYVDVRGDTNRFSGAEVDYIERRDGLVMGYEFKSGKKKSRSRVSWQADYPDASFEVVSQEDWVGFVG